MLRLNHNLKILDAKIEFIGAAYGDNIKTVRMIKNKINQKERSKD